MGGDAAGSTRRTSPHPPGCAVAQGARRRLLCPPPRRRRGHAAARLLLAAGAAALLAVAHGSSVEAPDNDTYVDQEEAPDAQAPLEDAPADAPASPAMSAPRLADEAPSDDDLLCSAQQRVQSGACVPCPALTISPPGADPSGGDSNCTAARKLQVQLLLQPAAASAAAAVLRAALARGIAAASAAGGWLALEPLLLHRCTLPEPRALAAGERADASVCTTLSSTRRRPAAAAACAPGAQCATVLEAAVLASASAGKLLDGLDSQIASDAAFAAAFISVIAVVQTEPPLPPPPGSAGSELPGGLYAATAGRGCRATPAPSGWRRLKQALPARGCRELLPAAGDAAALHGDVLNCSGGAAWLRLCKADCSACAAPQRAPLRAEQLPCLAGPPGVGLRLAGSCPADSPVLELVFAALVPPPELRVLFIAAAAQVLGSLPRLVTVVRLVAAPQNVTLWFQLLLQDDVAEAIAAMDAALSEPASPLYALGPLSKRVTEVGAAVAPPDRGGPAQQVDKKLAPVAIALMCVCGVCACCAAGGLVAACLAPSREERRAVKEASARRKAEEARHMHEKVTLV
eukprot:TRINITY_DN60228_c0_g1_i1.p1 TRINITY_DN60228_c0_g1~~TRINITY_DN60228_c0_g1_i1.p1  ORF type:complete len:574 (+),score=160.37 TRINITY_DN60228_c0_g1_i1:80-1801(+)